MVAHGRDTSPAKFLPTLSYQLIAIHSGRRLSLNVRQAITPPRLKQRVLKCPIGWSARSKLSDPLMEIARFRNARIGNDQDGELQLVTGLSRCDPRNAAPSRCRVNK